MVELPQDELPAGYREYARAIASSHFATPGFPDLQSEMMSGLQGRPGERQIAGMAAVTGNSVDEPRLEAIIVIRGKDEADGPIFGEFIYAVRWVEGPGFLRLLVGLENGLPRLYGTWVGLIEPGRTIRQYVDAVRRAYGLRASVPQTTRPGRFSLL
ncbi:MAG: hypothetical protein R3C39_01260 [Dehalococcoidia bacterium]